LVSAYIFLVGIPILCLFGILELGRGVAAPLSVGGAWSLTFETNGTCAGVSALRQPALNVSQSGTEALIMVNDGRGTVFSATVAGSALRGRALDATITGKSADRGLHGLLTVEGCPAVPFRAVRVSATPRKGE